MTRIKIGDREYPSINAYCKEHPQYNPLIIDTYFRSFKITHEQMISNFNQTKLYLGTDKSNLIFKPTLRKLGLTHEKLDYFSNLYNLPNYKILWNYNTYHTPLGKSIFIRGIVYKSLFNFCKLNPIYPYSTLYEALKTENKGIEELLNNYDIFGNYAGKHVVVKGKVYPDYKTFCELHPKYKYKRIKSTMSKYNCTFQEVIYNLDTFGTCTKGDKLYIHKKVYEDADHFFKTNRGYNVHYLKLAMKDTGKSLEEIVEFYDKTGYYIPPKKVIINGKIFISLETFFKLNPEFDHNQVASIAEEHNIRPETVIEQRSKYLISYTIHNKKYPSLEAYFKEHPQYTYESIYTQASIKGVSMLEVLNSK